MARPAVLVIPGRLETRTGGYIYDRRVVEGLRGLGWSVDVCELDASFPHPTPAAMAHARDAFASIPAGAVVLVDSLALGAIPDLIERHSTRLRTVALVHLPLSADVAIAPSERADVLETEGRALRSVHLVIVTGHAAVPLLDDYRIPSRIVVIEPGTDRAPLARGAGGSPLRLLTVATLNAGKGYEELLVSLSAVPSRNWRLTCAGSLERDPKTAEQIQTVIRRLDLDDHVILAGELDADALETCYLESDLFVLATRRETYGMAVAEALAHGLPVVAPATGAIPDLVGDDAGFVVPPGDTAALTEALTQAIDDEACRARLAGGARRVRERLPTWEHAVAQMAAALESIDHD